MNGLDPELDPERIFTLPELARYLRVDKRTVYRYLHTRRLTATKLPGARGCWRIRGEAVAQFVKQDGGQPLRVVRRTSHASRDRP